MQYVVVADFEVVAVDLGVEPGGLLCLVVVVCSVVLSPLLPPMLKLAAATMARSAMNWFLCLHQCDWV